jgi:hypothetical protein
MMVASHSRNTVASNFKTTYQAYYKFKQCIHHIRRTVPHAHSKNLARELLIRKKNPMTQELENNKSKQDQLTD